jgi:hypothetical protein
VDGTDAKESKLNESLFSDTPLKVGDSINRSLCGNGCLACSVAWNRDRCASEAALRLATKDKEMIQKLARCNAARSSPAQTRASKIREKCKKAEGKPNHMTAAYAAGWMKLRVVLLVARWSESGLNSVVSTLPLCPWHGIFHSIHNLPNQHLRLTQHWRMTRVASLHM